jgi:DNA primase
VTWVNFKQLRKSLDFEKVLVLYGVTVKRGKGNRHQGFCPLSTHYGKRKTPSFSAKLDWGAWQCFGCGASGNILDFAVRMEGLDPANKQDLRRVAIKLQEHFGIVPTGDAKSKGIPDDVPDTEKSTGLPTIVNAPLDFELKNLDPNHPYLLGRGFTSETIAYFGLGFCSKGLMKDRLVIPLRDHKGALVGYAGRVVDDRRITEANPRYRFPSGRERDGVYYDFQKSLFLYNAFAVARDGRLREICIVESFTACWWLFQNGFHSVVAVMGASCSSDQAKLITRLVVPGGLVIILSDGDEAGERCAVSVFTEVAPYRAVRWAKLPDGKQPTDFAATDLEKILGKK